MQDAKAKPQKKFDLKVHIRDPKTGRIVRTEPYSLRISSVGQVFTRHGVDYHPDGTQIDPAQKPIITKTKEEIQSELIEKGLQVDSEKKKIEAERQHFRNEAKKKDNEIANMSKSIEELQAQVAALLEAQKQAPVADAKPAKPAATGKAADQKKATTENKEGTQEGF